MHFKKTNSHVSSQICATFIISLFFLSACSTYPEIKINKKFNDYIYGANIEIKSNTNTRIQEILRRYNVPAGDEKSYPTEQKIIYNLGSSRYFAKVFFGPPLSYINNKGVELALVGKYSEAGIVFGEVLNEDKTNPESCNNLGIICELTEDKDKAFQMYSTACLRDPDNKFYRWNLLNFCDMKSPKNKQKEDIDVREKNVTPH